VRRMRLDWRCPECGDAVRSFVESAPDTVPCPSCTVSQPVVAPPASGVPVDRCALCGGRALYAAKDFPRKTGLAIVFVAAVLAPITAYVSLFVAALLDAGLYLVLGDATVCYACKTEHRGTPRNPEHAPYDIHVAEPFQYGDGGGDAKDA